MTDNMRQALRNQNEKARIKIEQDAAVENAIKKTGESILTTIASIALLLA